MTSAGSAPDALDAMVTSLAHDPVRVAWQPVDAMLVPNLTAAEASLVARAVQGRQAEFATGRTLLRGLIGDDVEILRTETGAPVLPTGFVGSLAHDREVAIAAVAPSDGVSAIGIDVEPVQQLEIQVADLVVRTDDIVPDAPPRSWPRRLRTRHGAPSVVRCSSTTT